MRSEIEHSLTILPVAIVGVHIMVQKHGLKVFSTNTPVNLKILCKVASHILTATVVQEASVQELAHTGIDKRSSRLAIAPLVELIVIRLPHLVSVAVLWLGLVIHLLLVVFFG